MCDLDLPPPWRGRLTPISSTAPRDPDWEELLGLASYPLREFIVATANSLVALRAIVVSLETARGDLARYSLSQLMVQQQVYTQRRPEMEDASAAGRRV